MFIWASDTHTDILPRTVNFLIFVAIIYYILADKAKAYFKDRTTSIEDRFQEIEEQKLQNQKKIDEAEKELEKAKILASKIVEEAISNQNNIKQTILKTTDDKIQQLIKKIDENIYIQTEKLKTQTVSNFLDRIFENKNIQISAKDISNIIKKKVA
jgi:F-type H+-transporting ATPase subunit b